MYPCCDGTQCPARTSPGDGNNRLGQWTEVIGRILDSGKSCQVYANAEDVDLLTREIGPERMLYIVTDTQESILKLADRYRLEAWHG